MEKKTIPVVKLAKKGIDYVYCPLCHNKHCFGSTKKQIEEGVCEGKDYIETVQSMREEVLCEKCGEEYLIDFGKSTYRVYDPPRTISLHEEMYSEYHSDWNYDFEIIIKDIPWLDKWYKVYCEYGKTCFILMDSELSNNPQKIISLAKEHWKADHSTK